MNKEKIHDILLKIAPFVFMIGFLLLGKVWSDNMKSDDCNQFILDNYFEQLPSGEYRPLCYLHVNNSYTGYSESKKTDFQLDLNKGFSD